MIGLKFKARTGTFLAHACTGESGLMVKSRILRILHENHKVMILSTCGLKCDECEFYNKSCTGCRSIKGAPFWAVEMMPARVCPLYDCAVNQRGYKDCGDCAELPCATFLRMKDPSTSDEEHQRMLGVRVDLLRAEKN